MKYTNKYNLPPAIVEAIVNSGYTKGSSDITVTELIDPPRLIALKHKHEAELEQDVSELIYVLQGNSIHNILEKAAATLPTAIVEERFYTVSSGWKLGGKIDIYYKDSGLLQDYKVTSAWSFKGGVKEEYVKQLNINAELLRQAGHPIYKLEIYAIFRDWSKLEAARDEKYPQSQSMAFDVPIIPAEDVRAFIDARVNEHKAAKEILPLCSREERWAKPDVWAIKKRGAAKAWRLCESEEAAQLLLADLDKAYYIEHRPGENTRCKYYCPVAKFCSQYKELTNKEKKDNGE